MKRPQHAYCRTERCYPAPKVPGANGRGAMLWWWEPSNPTAQCPYLWRITRTVTRRWWWRLGRVEYGPWSAPILIRDDRNPVGVEA